MTPKEALAGVEELDKFGINLGLSRIIACLEALGRPQDSYRTIHIAGTNGKGSTSALVAGMLQGMGYKTGLYTSPPLNHFGERMRINGQLMPDENLPGLFEKVKEAQGKIPGDNNLTQFEFITAMAFLYFAQQKVDVAVIEVGMGGRLDSTNVITPLACAITNVGLDHANELGATVEAIAAEKAGVIKPGVPVSTAALEPALSVIVAQAQKVCAPLKVLGRDFGVTQVDDTLTYKGKRTIEGLELSLGGPYQRDNLAVALSVMEGIEESGLKLDFSTVKASVKNTKWPGRLELFGKGPRVLIDGAHNPHAAARLKEALEQGYPRRKLILVLGILGDKDAHSMVDIIIPLADEVILTRSQSKRALGPEEIQKIAGESNKIKTAPSVAQSIEMALKEATEDDLVLVTGSLTVVGEARAWLVDKGI